MAGRSILPLAGASFRCTDSVGRSTVGDDLPLMGTFGLSMVAPFVSLREPQEPGTELLVIDLLLNATRLGLRGTVERFGPGR